MWGSERPQSRRSAKLNSEAAIQVSEAEGCKIITSSLGGNLGRQLQFHIGAGEVALRWLGKTEAENVIDECAEPPGFPIE